MGVPSVKLEMGELTPISTTHPNRFRSGSRCRPSNSRKNRHSTRTPTSPIDGTLCPEANAVGLPQRDNRGSSRTIRSHGRGIIHLERCLTAHVHIDPTLITEVDVGSIH